MGVLYIAPTELHIWVGCGFVAWHPGGVSSGSYSGDNSGLMLNLTLYIKGNIKSMAL